MFVNSVLITKKNTEVKMENEHIDLSFLDEDEEYRIWLDEQYEILLKEYEAMAVNEEYDELQSQYI